MKPYLIIKLDKKVPLIPLPYWGEVIKGHAEAPSRFLATIDRLFQQHQLGIKATREYELLGDRYEFLEGLERTYRLILTQNKTILEALLTQLFYLEEVDGVEKGEVSLLALPKIEKKTLEKSTKEDWGVHKAHQQFTKGSTAITIAVLDSGVDLDHPELQEALLPGRDFVNIIRGEGRFIGDYLGIDDDPDDEHVGHGTHVSGIIAAKGIQMDVGVAPLCKILPVRVLGSMKSSHGGAVGAALVHNIDQGIKWAVDQGADIINMSLGILKKGASDPHQRMISYALRKGVTIIAASGNDGSSKLHYPAALRGCMAIGAMSSKGKVAHFSNHGKVTLIAPGVDIYSSYLNGAYSLNSGTSQAAPFVSGVAALLKSYAYEKLGKFTKENLKTKRKLSRLIENILVETALPLQGKTKGKHKKSGYGIVQPYEALKKFQQKFNLN